jgi:hypothetical protein
MVRNVARGQTDAKKSQAEFEVYAMNAFSYLDGERVQDQSPAVWEWETLDDIPPDTQILSAPANARTCGSVGSLMSTISTLMPASWIVTLHEPVRGSDNAKTATADEIPQVDAD